MRLGEQVTEGGREFHRVTACGAKEHIKYVVFELYGSSWRGIPGGKYMSSFRILLILFYIMNHVDNMICKADTYGANTSA